MERSQHALTGAGAHRAGIGFNGSSGRRRIKATPPQAGPFCNQEAGSGSGTPSSTPLTCISIDRPMSLLLNPFTCRLNVQQKYVKHL